MFTKPSHFNNIPTSFGPFKRNTRFYELATDLISLKLPVELYMHYVEIRDEVNDLENKINIMT